MKKIVVGIFISVLTTHGAPTLLRRQSLIRFQKIKRSLRKLKKENKNITACQNEDLSLEPSGS